LKSEDLRLSKINFHLSVCQSSLDLLVKEMDLRMKVKRQ